MIKDIVINLAAGEQGDSAERYALSVAAVLEAHIAAVAFVYDPTQFVSQLGYIATGVVEAERREYESDAKVALDRFGDEARQGAISAEQLMLPVDFASIGDRFGRIARRFDLSIVAQVGSEHDVVGTMIIDGALFDSGRPMIVVPHTWTTPFTLDRAMVCWDGSRPAARAVTDALPLLASAGRIEVVVVTNGRGEDYGAADSDIRQHLARHGLHVEFNRIARGKRDVASVLLSRAIDSGADLIVMGGYGHSRLREFVLGGVTHSMLHSMTIPVLMSH